MPSVKFLVKKYLSKQDLETVSAKIAEVERQTSGEIRVAIRHRRYWNERKLSLHELALKEFSRLGMQQTKHNTGVLILLLTSERKFHIIADKGIHARVEDGAWDRIAADMSAHFRDGNFVKGLSYAIETVGNELKQHFPRTSGDDNELSNEIIEH